MTESAAILDGLPSASLERHVAILGTSDAGKTYAARGEVERLLAAGRRVGIIDPTGVWWGLKVRADGKRPFPHPVMVYGGDHEDLPFDPELGVGYAEGIARMGPGAIVLDVSRLTVGQRTRFFADFAEGLARENRQPLHLVIDEAHLFAPQGRVHDPMSGRMVHAANHLVAGGRALGLRIMMLSQRPAKLHKDSLTQIQTLVAMLNVSPQDRNAVKAWIADSADPALGAEILASLPGLPVGEGWIWAPRLDVLSRVKFRPITTLDSSRTPEHGETPAVGRLAREGEHVACAPSVFRMEEEFSVAEKRGFERGAARLLEVGLEARQEGYAEGHAVGLAEGWSRAMAVVRELTSREAPRAEPVAASEPVPEKVAKAHPKRAPASTPIAKHAGAERILEAIERGPARPLLREEITLLAAMAPNAGHTRQSVNLALQSDRVEVVEGGVMAKERRDPLTRHDVVRAWMGKLRRPADVFLLAMMDGQIRLPAQIAEHEGLTWNAGYVRGGWKRVRAAGLVVAAGGDAWRLADVLCELEG